MVHWSYDKAINDAFKKDCFNLSAFDDSNKKGEYLGYTVFFYKSNQGR